MTVLPGALDNHMGVVLPELLFSDVSWGGLGRGGVCVGVWVCVLVCGVVSSLSVLVQGWLCYATSGHAEESCFSPVTGHPLTCACSVGWAFTLSSLTAADVYSMNGGCEVYHHSSECFCWE